MNKKIAEKKAKVQEQIEILSKEFEGDPEQIKLLQKISEQANELLKDSTKTKTFIWENDQNKAISKGASNITKLSTYFKRKGKLSARQKQKYDEYLNALAYKKKTPEDIGFIKDFVETKESLKIDETTQTQLEPIPSTSVEHQQPTALLEEKPTQTTWQFIKEQAESIVKVPSLSSDLSQILDSDSDTEISDEESTKDLEINTDTIKRKPIIPEKLTIKINENHKNNG